MKLTKLDPQFLNTPIAHRGLHNKKIGIAENSRSAFDEAIKQGFPIECDLQCTEDGKAVVFHDEKLERMTDETGIVWHHTLQEITAMKLKNSADKIQSLGEFLEQVAGQVPLLIEIKDQSLELGEFLGSFMDDILSQLKAYKGSLAIMSFNPYIIAHFRAHWPDACLGLTTDDFTSNEWPDLPHDRALRLNNFEEIPELKIDFISHNWQDLARVAHLNIPKLSWTIKTLGEEAQARQIADNITFERYMPERK